MQMASGLRSKSTNIFVYVLLGLLILGLAGFGVGNFGGSVRSIGKVGETDIPLDSYYRALQQELAATSAQNGGQALPMAQAQIMGLDRAVLSRVVALSALDNEATRIGLSVGDRAVLDEISQMQEFTAITGGFDEETYKFVLEQSGLSPSEFEEQMRTDITRTLLQQAVTGGVAPSDTYSDALITFLSEQRDLEWARIGPDALQSPLPDPDATQIKAHYDANPARYTLPEQRVLRFVWLTPDMLLDQIEVDETTLRTLYDERADLYDRAEARLVERLIYGDAAAAADAAARLDAGSATFEELVAERGLELADVDLGDVAASDLPDAVSGPVFDLSEPGIVGPLDSALGPALYRVNAILPAQNTPFEDVRDTLRDDFARDAARRRVTDSVADIDDLLAGGATLDEIAGETDMELGDVTLPGSAGTGADIAAYEEFRAAANGAQVGDYAEVAELSDGSIYAFELVEIIPPSLQPLDEVRDTVIADWRIEATRAALVEQANAHIDALDAGQKFSELGLDAVAETGLTRDRFVPDTPPILVSRAFELDPGKASVVEGADDAYVVRLVAITPPDDADADVAQIRAILDQQFAQGVAADIYDLFAQNRSTSAGIDLNQAAINAVHAQIP